MYYPYAYPRHPRNPRFVFLSVFFDSANPETISASMQVRNPRMGVSFQCNVKQFEAIEAAHIEAPRSSKLFTMAFDSPGKPLQSRARRGSR